MALVRGRSKSVQLDTLAMPAILARDRRRMWGLGKIGDIATARPTRIIMYEDVGRNER